MSEIIEVLEKKCPRCGGASANSSNSSGRCSACLKKLASNKKKPGHWQRAQTKADDALRRQKGKNGTASKKTSGLGSRKSIVKQTQAAEKKTGEKLSPDRKNNSKGYAAKNTRMVPEKLNRGRHHVDPKKLAAWKKKLKKSELDTASLYTLMKAKFSDNPEALELLKSIGPEGLEQCFNLEKSAAPKLEPVKPTPTGLAAEIGKTHTVEVHPDLDHLYRAKGLIKENNRTHLNIGDYKKHGFSSDIIKKLPRDAHGKVTPEMIDKHIASLPKKKINVSVQPYTWRSQQHRPGEQVALSVQMHPEEHMKMHPDHKDVWEEIRNNQHIFHTDKQAGVQSNQIGWSRIDPSKENHWHIDEIQSDFQNKDKLNSKLDDRDYTNEEAKAAHDFMLKNPDHPMSKRFMNNELKESGPYGSPMWEILEGENNPFRDEFRKLTGAKPKKKISEAERSDMLSHLSHGHDDPQHMIHSATNALARKLGVKSMSMDTPKDQAKQSGLIDDTFESQGADYYINHNFDNEYKRYHDGIWNDPDDSRVADMIDNHSRNPNFASALKAVGGRDALSNIARSGSKIEHLSNVDEHKEFNDKFNKLSIPEQDALKDFNNQYRQWVGEQAYESLRDTYHENSEEDEPQEKLDFKKLPVHQIDTYHKRPRKLGMKEVDKSSLLGSHSGDNAKTVQYMNLHKKIQEILSLIKKDK